MKIHLKAQLVVIQPTSFCNINCRYCYLPHRALTKRISVETLSQVFKALFDSPFVSDDIEFVWHAGEPLVLPIRFYERAFQLQQKWNSNGVNIVNSFQTNATLVTEKWCQFFKAHNIHIGVSLDGPASMHNANRTDRAGQGTFERVMRGIELLKANAVRYSVIAVVSKDSVAYPDEFWQFFSDMQPSLLGLNPEELEGANRVASLATDEDIYLYGQFFKRLLALNQHSKRPVLIREVENLTRLIRYAPTRVHAQTNAPLTILSFDCDGNVSTFSPELLTMSHPVYDNFIFGNVFEGPLEDIISNPKFIEVNAQIQQGVEHCRETCEYFAMCGGGSPSNKLFENGTFDSTETIACRMKVKITTDRLLDYLEEKYYIELSPLNTRDGQGESSMTEANSLD